MEKLFVPYDLALKLKEKGFNEPRFGEYRQWDGNNAWLQLYQDLSETSTDPADYEYTIECNAPIYQQIINWLREKHQIKIVESEYFSDNCIFWYIKEYHILSDKICGLNNAIEEALKLI